MGLVDKPAFTAGELDPALWERTNLDKYRNGLATGRNWFISKTGSVLTRSGRAHMWVTKIKNSAVILYSPPGGGVLMEWGHQYVRVYSLQTQTLLGDIAHAFVETDIPFLQFETSGSYVYIFCSGKNVLKFNYATGVFVSPSLVFAVPPAPFAAANTNVGAPTGYEVEYAITFLLKGEESLPFYLTNSPNIKLPITAGTANSIGYTLAPVSPLGANPNPYITQVNVYRRPKTGGAFGFVGSSTSFTTNLGSIVGTFIDVGADADYTHQPPLSLMANSLTVAPASVQTPNSPVDPGTLLSITGCIYQQRLLITDTVTDLEAIYASQPGFQDNFFRNFPLDAASALKFKCGTSGYARVYRLLDSDGLVAFTAAGIYLNQGELGPSNLTMAKKGKWIIYPYVPPLSVPGGVFFVDSATNGVRNLLWSFQLNAFDADELSIYSNHLFKTRLISTWNFQQGFFPLLWVVFSDGTTASFTFDYNQQMQAWMRHDSAIRIRSSAGTTNADQCFFVTSKVDANGDTIRYIEMTLPRYVPPLYIANDQDWDKNQTCAYMDSIISRRDIINAVCTFSTSVLEDWTQPLRLSCGTAGLFVSPGAGAVGEILRMFDDDGSAIDFEVLTHEDDNNVIVEMINTDVFDQDNWTTGRQIYRTATQVVGLDHLETEYPAVIVDGAVVCSPNNDVDNYPEVQVINGVLTLPQGIRGAIIHVGRPIVGDVETLDIDTVEQGPTLIESITVNKIYVKVHDSKGLFVGNKFPVEQLDDAGNVIVSANGVTGMESLDSFPVDYSQATPIIGNRAQPAQTRRHEITLEGSYESQGKICVRQVDPLHAEILSLIPDVEILKRSDR